VKIAPSIAAISAAEDVLKDLNINLGRGDTFGVIKIRHGYVNGNERRSFIACTQPEVLFADWAKIVSKHVGLQNVCYKEISDETDGNDQPFCENSQPVGAIPKVWLIFSDTGIDPEYMDAFLSYYRSHQKDYQHFIDKLIPEREITYHGKELNKAFPDNYFVIRMIRHLMNISTFSVGSHYYEGNQGYTFCENQQNYKNYYVSF
jgi:hypothetical protein